MTVEKKQRKRKTQRKWRANEEIGVVRELKTGRQLPDFRSIWKSYLHLRCYVFCLRYMSFLAFALDLYWRIIMKRVNETIFWGNLRLVLVKFVSRTFGKKRRISYISFSIFTRSFRYIIVYTDENCLGLKTLVGTWSKSCIFPWQSPGDVRNIIWWRFCKTSQTCELYNYRLEKLIVCLYGPGKQGKQK